MKEEMSKQKRRGKRRVKLEGRNWENEEGKQVKLGVRKQKVRGKHNKEVIRKSEERRK